METVLQRHLESELSSFDEYIQRIVDSKLQAQESRLRSDFSLQLVELKGISDSDLAHERQNRTLLENQYTKLQQNFSAFKRRVENSVELIVTPSGFGADGVGGNTGNGSASGVSVTFSEEVNRGQNGSGPNTNTQTKFPPTVQKLLEPNGEIDKRVMEKLKPIILEFESNMESLVEIPLQARIRELETQLLELENRTTIRDDAFSATLMDLERAVDGLMREGVGGEVESVAGTDVGDIGPFGLGGFTGVVDGTAGVVRKDGTGFPGGPPSDHPGIAGGVGGVGGAGAGKVKRGRGVLTRVERTLNDVNEALKMVIEGVAVAQGRAREELYSGNEAGAGNEAGGNEAGDGGAASPTSGVRGGKSSQGTGTQGTGVRGSPAKVPLLQLLGAAGASADAIRNNGVEVNSNSNNSNNSNGNKDRNTPPGSKDGNNVSFSIHSNHSSNGSNNGSGNGNNKGSKDENNNSTNGVIDKNNIPAFFASTRAAEELSRKLSQTESRLNQKIDDILETNLPNRVEAQVRKQLKLLHFEDKVSEVVTGLLATFSEDSRLHHQNRLEEVEFGLQADIDKKIGDLSKKVHDDIDARFEASEGVAAKTTRQLERDFAVGLDQSRGDWGALRKIVTGLVAEVKLARSSGVWQAVGGASSDDGGKKNISNGHGLTNGHGITNGKLNGSNGSNGNAGNSKDISVGQTQNLVVSLCDHEFNQQRETLTNEVLSRVLDALNVDNDINSIGSKGSKDENTNNTKPSSTPATALMTTPHPDSGINGILPNEKTVTNLSLKIPHHADRWLQRKLDNAVEKVIHGLADSVVAVAGPLLLKTSEAKVLQEVAGLRDRAEGLIGEVENLAEEHVKTRAELRKELAQEMVVSLQEKISVAREEVMGILAKGLDERLEDMAELIEANVGALLRGEGMEEEQEEQQQEEVGEEQGEQTNADVDADNVVADAVVADDLPDEADDAVNEAEKVLAELGGDEGNEQDNTGGDDVVKQSEEAVIDEAAADLPPVDDKPPSEEYHSPVEEQRAGGSAKGSGSGKGSVQGSVRGGSVQGSVQGGSVRGSEVGSGKGSVMNSARGLQEGSLKGSVQGGSVKDGSGGGSVKNGSQQGSVKGSARSGSMRGSEVQDGMIIGE